MRPVRLMRCAQIVAAATTIWVLMLALPVLTSLGGQATATTTAQILLSKKVGPPTSVVSISGSGFGASETVGIFFDSTMLAGPQANGSGAFGLIKITIPASALPGRHTISAKGSSTGLVATAAFTVRTDWAQFRFGPGHSGYNRFENVVGTSNAATLQKKWSLVTGAWVESSPAVAGGVLYIGSDDGKLYAVRAVSGKSLWTFSTPRPLHASPAVAHGVVYVGTAGGGPILFALAAGTGQKLWSFSVTNTSTAVLASPTVANGVVYISATNGYLYALNAATGKRLWSFHVGSSNEISPAVANGVVFTASTTGTIYAVNGSTGQQLWSFSTGGVGNTSPAVMNGVLYQSFGDTLYALDAATGQEKWSFVPHGGYTITSSPAVANGIVYVGDTEGAVYALYAASGGYDWMVLAVNTVASSPAVANGVVYFGSADGNIYAHNAADGSYLWSYTTRATVNSSPAVANGYLYVGSNDDNLYAFTLP